MADGSGRVHGHSGIREIILLHNRDDVIQLSRLLPVLEKTDFHKAMHCLGFLVKPGAAFSEAGEYLLINKITIGRNALAATGVQGENPKDYRSFGNCKGEFKIDFKKP